MGVWIETEVTSKYTVMKKSHPSWVCGLKQSCTPIATSDNNVTPFVGVWIETPRYREPCARSAVTPFVGVWIETSLPYHLFLRLPSHTLRGCVD